MNARFLASRGSSGRALLGGFSLLLALHAAFAQYPPESDSSEYQIDTSVCGFNVERSRVELCSKKGLCKAACQVATCEALVRFGSATGLAAWPSDVDSCRSIKSFAYCSWPGVSCCCLQPADMQAPQRSQASTCDWCQVVNGSRVGSVNGIRLQDIGLNGSLPELLQLLEPLGALGLHEIALQGNNISSELPAGLASMFPELAVLDLGSNPGLPQRPVCLSVCRGVGGSCRVMGSGRVCACRAQ